MEKAIILSYRKLRQQKDFPAELETLFSVVNLCSDDELVVLSSDDDNDDDEVEIVGVVQSNKSVVNRIKNSVSEEVNDKKNDDVVVIKTSSVTPPKSPAIKSPKPENSSSLPLDEDNKPIFFRRNNLPTEPEQKSAKSPEKVPIEATPKKKKKNKKEKRSKEKSLKKHKKDVSLMPLQTAQDKTNGLVEPTTSHAESVKDIEHMQIKTKNEMIKELSQKSLAEIVEVASKNKIIENLGLSFLSSITTDLPVRETIEKNRSEQSKTPNSELSNENQLTLESVVQSNSEAPARSSTSLQAQYPLQPSITNHVSAEAYSGLNSLPIPTTPTLNSSPSCNEPNPVPQPNLYNGLLQTPAYINPHVNTNSSLLPLPTLTTSHSKDPRVHKMLNQSQYGSHITTGVAIAAPLTSPPANPSLLPIVPQSNLNCPNVQNMIPTITNGIAKAPTLMPEKAAFTVPPQLIPNNVSGSVSMVQYPDLHQQRLNHGIPVVVPQTHKAPMMKLPHLNGTLAATTTTTGLTKSTGFTKSHITYGEAKREKQMRERAEHEAKLREERERQRRQEEAEARRKRLESEKAERERLLRYERDVAEKRRIEKEKEQANNEAEKKRIQEREQEIHTKEIKRILSNHEAPIVKLIQESEEKKRKKRQSQSPTKEQPNAKRPKTTDNNEEHKKNAKNARFLKQIEISFKGFDTMQDFLPKTISGKRRCSLSARKAIAEQSGNYEYSDEETQIDNQRKRLSSSSTESLCYEKRKKKADNLLKMQKKMKNCKVVLERMTEDFIKLHTHKNTSTKKENSLKNLFKSCENSNNNNQATGKIPTLVIRNIPKPVIQKNIDCCMTERQCKECVICQKKPKNLTSHYIHIHKSESYVSRLLWEELDDLVLKPPFAEEVSIKTGDPRIPQYKVKCPFCPSDRSDVTATFANLRRHYSTHTGEYSFSCNGCKLQSSFRDELRLHQHGKKCSGTGIKTMYQYPRNQMVIYLYICHICNFVQLNEQNVFKHLREQHCELKEGPNFVKQITLVAIKDVPVERVALNTLPNITPSIDEIINRQDEQTLCETDKVCVSNEPLIDENNAGMIKTEPGIDLDINSNEFEDENFFKDIMEENLNNVKTENISMMIDESTIMQQETVDIKPDVEALKALLTTDTTDTLDKKPNAEMLSTESAKALLRKYTEKTGVRPELLYQCPQKECGGYFSGFSLWLKHMKAHHNSIIASCPHCVAKADFTEWSVDDFENHFKSHCMRLYLCFHCDARCIDEIELREHVKAKHPEKTEMRIESISYNISYTFYIIIEQNLLVNRLDFLNKLYEVFKERVDQLENAATSDENFNTTWRVCEGSLWFENLQLPEFQTKISTKTCLMNKCKETFETQDELIQHIYSHNARIEHDFLCTFCNFKTPGINWRSLISHLFFHSELTYVCCVCSFKACCRQDISKHVCENHDRRDVPLLQLKRTKQGITTISLQFVFATGTRTFTTQNCFCGCDTTKNNSHETLVAHLNREHLFKLQYFCEYCNERLTSLQLSDEHHNAKHAQMGRPLKIRCQLAVGKEHQINVVSSQPLCINVTDQDKNIFKTEHLASCLEKEEDEEVIIMEEDEVIAEDEVKKAKSTENKPRPIIICKNILQLKPRDLT